MAQIRLLGSDDIDILLQVSPGLFDKAIDPEQTRRFLNDPHHAITVAIEAADIVSFASGTVLLHPDKAPAMFVNEVGTRDSHLRRGLATAVTHALIAHARDISCDGIWLGTEPDNAPALALYRKLRGKERPFIGFAWDGAFDDD